MDLQWSPVKPDQLITWGQEVALYKIEDCDLSTETPPAASIPISASQVAVLSAKLGDYPGIRALDSYPGTDAEEMIAIGLGNGKIVLSSFGASLISKEFVPKHPRQINCVSWNLCAPNILGVGFDKSRSDYAVAIWDIGGGGNRFISGGIHSDSLRPVMEIGNSETAHSFAWVSTHTLLVGMNGKHIKLFDLRDTQAKLERSAATKAVCGICIDGFGNHRVASFAENQVNVWDMRNFDKPFVVLNHSRNINRIGWCPTRSGLLACLEKDSASIQIHDVHHAALASEEGEPAVLERRFNPTYVTGSQSFLSNRGSLLSSFAWHPIEENAITTVNFNGVLWNSIVYERITLNWSTTSKLGWSDGKKNIQYIDHTDTVYTALDDISVKMKERALAGYGLKANLKENAPLVQENEFLRRLWNWLEFCQILIERERYRVPSVSGLKFPGVRTILRMDTPIAITIHPMKSEVLHNSSFELHNNKTYRSEERSLCQQLCGWLNGGLAGSLDDCANSSTRKAAIALFHLKLRQCIKLLSESGHTIVAMAIAGFTDDRSSLWREMAQSNCTQLDDPYIRAIFSFLTESDGNYDSILNEPGLSVADRVGFACSFLPDAKLIAYIHELTNQLTSTGNLDGLLLTGMTTHAHPLLQVYLDMTADVQTVSLLAVRTMAQDIPDSFLLKYWIDRYRDLLNSWKLWELRAEFDIIKNANNSALIPPPEVTVSCNFCGKNISPAGLGGPARTAQLFARFTTTNTKIKLSCCPSCRKPLPRCAICLTHMGTVLASGAERSQSHREVSQAKATKQIVKVGTVSPSTESLSWYTWCQTCRHGGHTTHLQQWFKDQMECPVTGCTCRCITLDRIVDFPPS